MKFSKEETDQIVKEAVERGMDHYGRGEMERAEELLNQVLQVEPDNFIALQIIGLIESKKPGKLDEAIAKLKKAEALAPDNADVHNNLGLVYSWAEKKNAEEATRHFRKAIELNPNGLHFYSNLGIHLKSIGEQAEAEEIMLKGLELEDASTMLHFNYATMLGEQKRWKEAKHHYNKAIELDPDLPSAHYNLATVLLNEGDWNRGWKEYEWRWETYPMFKKVRDRFPKEKLWTGKQPIEGKRILLYAEQGMGDTIQFCRFASMLKHQGAYVILEEHGDLADLLSTLDGPAEFILQNSNIPDFDYHCSLLSIPACFDLLDHEWESRSRSEISGKPYLRCNREKLKSDFIKDEYWNAYDGLKVGIVWAGSPVHRHDPYRSAKLTDFKELQLPNVKLFSLQKDTRPRFWPGIGEVDLTEGADGMSVVDMKDYMYDFNATAGIIEKLDLVIAVDTATAHVAAAIGKPVWLLVSHHNDWRWLASGSKTLWYDSMTIFRQSLPGDWKPVFEAVRKELATMCG